MNTLNGLPRSETEFLALMEEIDESLRKKNVSIPERPLKGASEIARKLNLRINCLVEKHDAIPNDFTKDSIAAHIFNWFDERYGNKLKVNNGPGEVAILIKEDPYRIIFPRIFGSAILVCDRNVQFYNDFKSHSIPIFDEPIIPLNVLLFIEDLSERLINVLSDEELRDILNYFTSSYRSLEILGSIKTVPLVYTAIGDLKSAVSHIFSRPPQYGLSKWSSLQFIEKLVKAYLVLNNAKPQRTHNLEGLVAEANRFGLPLIPNELINEIQCSADIRYEGSSVTLEEAISAHHLSLHLCGALSSEIKKAI